MSKTYKVGNETYYTKDHLAKLNKYAEEHNFMVQEHTDLAEMEARILNNASESDMILLWGRKKVSVDTPEEYKQFVEKYTGKLSAAEMEAMDEIQKVKHFGKALWLELSNGATEENTR